MSEKEHSKEKPETKADQTVKRWAFADLFRLSKRYSTIADNSLKWDYSILGPYLQAVLTLCAIAILSQFLVFSLLYFTGIDEELGLSGVFASLSITLTSIFCWVYFGYAQRVYAYGHVAIIYMVVISFIIILFVSNGLAYHFFAIYNKFLSLLLISMVGAMVFNPRLVMSIIVFHLLVLSWSSYLVQPTLAEWVYDNLFYLTNFICGYVLGLVVEDLFEGRDLLNKIQVNRNIMQDVKGEAASAVLRHSHSSLIICDEFGRHIFNSSNPPFSRDLIYRLDPFLQNLSQKAFDKEEGLNLIGFTLVSPIYRDAQSAFSSAVCRYNEEDHFIISFGILPDGGRFFFVRKIGDSNLSHSLSFINTYQQAGRIWFSRQGEYLRDLGLDIVEILQLPRQSPDFATLEKGLNLGANQSVELGKYFEFQRKNNRYIGVIHLVGEGFIFDFWLISQNLVTSDRLKADTLFHN